MSVDSIEFSRRGDAVFKTDELATPYTGATQHGHLHLAGVRAMHQPVRRNARAGERAPDADDRPFRLPYLTMALE